MNVCDLILTREPWAIAPEAMDGIIGLSMDLASGKSPFQNKANPKAPIMSISDGVATINITGPLLPSVDDFSREVLGATGLDEIQLAVEAASADPSVKSIHLAIDSPGGTVRGTPETADAIYAASKVKTVTAHTSGMMASAAYWLGSQAQSVTMTRSASAGSIGVMVPHIDQSKRAEMMGVKVELFTTGKYKAAGFPGTTLTDMQRELIQERIDQVFTDFKSAITRQGRSIPANAMEGQTFYGPQAESLGLAKVVGSKYKYSSAKCSSVSAVDTQEEGMESQDTNSQLEESASEAIAEQVDNETEPQPEPTEVSSDNAQSTSDLISDLTNALATMNQKLEAQHAELAEFIANKVSFDDAVAAKAAAIAARTTSNPVDVTPDNSEANTLDGVLAEMRSTTSPTEKYRLATKAAELRAKNQI